MELHEFAVGGNIYELEKGCCMTLFNVDEQDNEIDTVYIDLDQKRLKTLISMLEAYVLKGE